MSGIRSEDVEAGRRAGWPRYAFAEGCAHRDRQTLAFLRARARDLRPKASHAVLDLADAIERGEHVTGAES